MSKRNHKKKSNSLIGTILTLIILGGIWYFTGGKPEQLSRLFDEATQKVTVQTKSVTSNSRLADLTYKSGESSYVYINHNQAKLNPAKWKTNRVIYAKLDSLNRTSTGNLAYLERRNLASDENRVRQYVEPTGWHQKFVNRQPIINRGHLIAYSISKGINQNGHYSPHGTSGDQNNPKNLFTQSAFSNQRIQTIYEQKIRTALRANKRVIFFSKPIFKGHDLMARGIHLEAISTDRSLNFNVYIFNVQPNIKFNYATGRSTIDRTMSVPEP